MDADLTVEHSSGPSGAARPAPQPTRSPEQFVAWVAGLPADGSTSLADVVAAARGVTGAGDVPGDRDWRPPFMPVPSAGAELDASREQTPESPRPDAEVEAEPELIAATEINPVYSGPGAASQPGGAGYPTAPPAYPAQQPPGYGPQPGYPPQAPPQPGYPPQGPPQPGYGPPPGYPPQPPYRPQPGYPPPGPPQHGYPPPGYPSPGYPPQGYGPGYPPPGYPPPGPQGYGPQGHGPQQAPGYGPPPGYPPPQQYGPPPSGPTPQGATPDGAAGDVPSPYFDPHGRLGEKHGILQPPGSGLLPAWDALSPQQQVEHVDGLSRPAQEQMWAQMTNTQRRRFSAQRIRRPWA